MQHHSKNRNQQSGFTLIELSIVLVIIGLIVGGVLVGQELINQARLRAHISQIEKYQAAVNTFQGKYNCKPGDCPTITTFFTAAVPGNGDGLISDDTTAAVADDGTSYNEAQDEVVTLFAHLSNANMIDSNQVSPAAVNTDAAEPLVGAGAAFPANKLGIGGGVAPVFEGGLNWFHVGVAPQLNTGALAFIPTLTPNQAFQVDTKVDDGLPQAGLMRARTGATAALVHVNPASTGDNQCLASTTTYNLSDSNGDADTALCQFRVRMM